MAAALHRQPAKRRAQGSGYPAQDLRQRALAWTVRLRVNPRVLRIQEMRKKWGSCSSAGTVTLAIDLIHQTQAFQDYVIVHELLHLRMPNHGKVFKALMTAYVPQWRHFESTQRMPGQASKPAQSLHR